MTERMTYLSLEKVMHDFCLQPDHLIKFGKVLYHSHVVFHFLCYMYSRYLNKLIFPFFNHNNALPNLRYC